MVKSKRLWINIVLIIIVASAIIFPFLGNVPLLDPDEPVYAETAREMVEFHDFLSPRIYGDFWYDKPPMYYWFIAGAFKIFGVNEFASRFPSAMLAVLGAAVIYIAGRNLIGERGAILAGLILASSLEYFYLGKAAVTDITLTFFLTAALLAFLHKRYYLFYAFAALAVVTKGPIGFFFCAAIVGLYIAVTGNWMLLRKIKLFRGTALFLIIALPWYVLMYHYHGMAFIDTFIGFHNVTRFLQPEHASGEIWYYYIPVLIMGFFPWTAFLGQAVYSSIKDKGPRNGYLVFMVIWAAVVFIFFSISQTKLVSYILPMYPPLAIIVGWYFDKIWSTNDFSRLTWSTIILTIVSGILIAGLLFTGYIGTEELYNPVFTLAGVFVMLVIFVWLFKLRGNFRMVFSTYIIAMIIFSTFIMTQLSPIIALSYSMKSFVQEFNQQYDGKTPIYVTKFYRPGFVFYSKLPSKEISAEDSLAVLLNNNTKGFFVVKINEYNSLPPSVKNDVRVLTVQKDKALLAQGVVN